MTSIDTAGVRIDSTRSNYGGLDSETIEMIDLGLVEVGHVHTCHGLLIEMAGTSWVRPAELNPMFGYWIGQDQAGRWTLASSLGGWNVLGHLEQVDGGQLADGAVYVLEHSEATAGQPCEMVIRQAEQDEIPHH